MCTLDGFPPLPEGGKIPVCELNGHLAAYISHANLDLSAWMPKISTLPKVTAPINVIRKTQSSQITNPNQFFLSEKTSYWQKIQNIWHGSESIAAIFETDNEFLRPVVRFLGKYVSRTYYTPEQRYLLYENSYEGDWKNDLFRMIKWHPQCTKFAVVTLNDTVYVYTGRYSNPSIISHRLQNDVTCVEFRINCSSTLAVGCAEGIYLWNVDPKITKPSLSCATLLSASDHKFISSISFNNWGDLLASCSLCDRKIYLWYIGLGPKQSTALRKFGDYTTLVSWAPNSSYFFANTKGVVYRIWNTHLWKYGEKWYVPKGHVTVVCWSPCSKHILFATSGDCSIYALSNHTSSDVFENPDAISQARCVADVSPFELQCHSMIGGIVRSMSWEPEGKYLAVIFKNCELVAIFTTSIMNNVFLAPRCIVKGKPNEIPLVIDFQRNFEHGCNLLIGWSSGRLQYFPMCNSNNWSGIPTVLTEPQGLQRIQDEFRDENAFLSF